MQKVKKRKVNLVDIILLVALLVAFGFMISHFAGVLFGNRDMKKIRYVLEVASVQTEFCTKAAAGDTVQEDQSGARIGQVSAISTSPSYYRGNDGSGRVIYTAIDGYNLLYITVEATAEMTDSGYLVNEYPINAGKRITVRLPNLYCEAECISVSVLD